MTGAPATGVQSEPVFHPRRGTARGRRQIGAYNLGSDDAVGVVNVTTLLEWGRLTPWADLSDDHGFVLTSAG
jgi:hypothetical protein